MATNQAIELGSHQELEFGTSKTHTINTFWGGDDRNFNLDDGDSENGIIKNP